MKTLFEYNYCSPGTQNINIAGSDRRIGMFYKEIDGYWVFYAECMSGYWTQTVLQELAIKLKELNDPRDKQVNEFFDAQKKTPE